jgi:hypothetical protein
VPVLPLPVPVLVIVLVTVPTLLVGLPVVLVPVDVVTPLLVLTDEAEDVGGALLAVAVCATTLFVAAPDALELSELSEHPLSTAATKSMAGAK